MHMGDTNTCSWGDVCGAIYLWQTALRLGDEENVAIVDWADVDNE